MSTYDRYEVEVEDEEKGLYKVNIGHKKKSLKQKISSWFSKYGNKIIFVAGIILIAGISFEAGYLKGQKNQKGSVIVNQPACLPDDEAGTPCPKSGEGNSANTTNNNPQQSNESKSETQPTTENQKCAYIASKNSNKYHLPTCQWATRIKPENKVCFSSVEEAESRGYQAAKCCIK